MRQTIIALFCPQAHVVPLSRMVFSNQVAFQALLKGTFVNRSPPLGNAQGQFSTLFYPVKAKCCSGLEGQMPGSSTSWFVKVHIGEHDNAHTADPILNVLARHPRAGDFDIGNVDFPVDLSRQYFLSLHT